MTKERDPQEMTRDEMIREIKDLRLSVYRYSNAWLRELGGKVLPKSHFIDSLVLTTRWMRERSDRLAVIEAMQKYALLEQEYGPSNLTIKLQADYERNFRTLPGDTVTLYQAPRA